MVLYRENRQIVDKEIEIIKRRIQDEYQASNITFVEQTNQYCKFRGTKNDDIYIYSYDKNSNVGFIIESDD